ncbi:hypothetical protein SteCoe_9592 [Stentor coeruleus]|uniref:FCH domain-containing protein n=1 Tax=Stentor coeruleus TaxID=5963 RepID=A0A1R2CHJ5_9CILI|nr:hypothetical protein SteCoe_9592 [Stentor coeruleus]
MSYWDLWDNYSKVKENAEDTNSLIYYLIEFLTHKTEIEREYANGLNRLTRAPLFFRGKNTMVPCLKRLQTICNQQSISLLELVNNQQTDLIPTLKDLLTKQDEDIRINARISKDLVYELQKQNSYCEKTRDYYFSYCISSENVSKREEAAGKKYLKAVEDANNFLTTFEENMKPILMLYQKQEEDKILAIKDLLRKITIYELSYLRSSQYEKELLPLTVDSLNPEIEIKKFIDDNLTGKKFQKYVFEVHPKRLNTDILTINSENGKKNNIVIDNIIDKCWKGIVINDEDNKNFHNVISGTEGRKYWIKKLNDKRIENKYNIPSCAFGIVCGLTNLLLDRIQECQDLNCTKQVIMLSQHFYEETLSQKTFMYQILLTHSLWEDFKLWGNLVISSVDLEMKNDAKLCSEETTSLSQALKLRPVLSSKVQFFVQQMKNFMVDGNVVEKTLKVIHEYYGINIEVEKSNDDLN